MAKFRLNRRAMLRGAGGIAIALPWLEIMDAPRAHAQAVGSPAQRFLGVFTPGGAVINDTKGVNKWRPTGTEAAPILSPILAPLEPIKHKLLFLSGLDMTSKDGEQHQAGIIAWMSGTAQRNAPPNGGEPAGTDSYASGPSVDQRIATLVKAQGAKKFASLEMAVRWGTGKAHGLLSPISCANFEDSPKASPIAPRIDPVQIFKDLFGMGVGGGADDPALPRKKSILDHVLGEYNTLLPKLGTTDRATVQQHVDKLRDIEMGLTSMANGSATCKVPAQVDTTGYDAGCGDQCGGGGAAITTDEKIPLVGTYMMDMMVMALACDMTRVGTFQWTDTEAKHTFPWLQLPEHHHYYQHDGGFRPVECEKICTWYSTMHLHLLTEMDKVVMGADGHTLLDESVVFFGSELSRPEIHDFKDMPFMLAGKGGGLRGGRWLHHGNTANNANSHNNLLVSILNLFGDPATTFGNPELCAGPLASIT
ncbi:MAG TPA: DUF1552 domain-containing protein [Polyangiaceae bacterium]|nr:DUF1552 domain-containing protein [Polyangiaceae bacterium]